MKVTIIVPPHSESALAPGVGPRPLHKVDRFAAALARELGEDVLIVEGTLADAPPDGLLVTFGDFDVTAYAALAPRLVWINADRSKMRSIVAELGLTAAIEKHIYFQWQHEPGDDRGYGVYGRRDVATAIGAEITSMYPSADYGMLKSEAHPGLVVLLAAYLSAYVALRDGAKTVEPGSSSNLSDS